MNNNNEIPNGGTKDVTNEELLNKLNSLAESVEHMTSDFTDQEKELEYLKGYKQRADEMRW